MPDARFTTLIDSESCLDYLALIGENPGITTFHFSWDKSKWNTAPSAAVT